MLKHSYSGFDYTALPARVLAKGNRSRRNRKIVVVDDADRMKKILSGSEYDDEDEYDGRAVGEANYKNGECRAVSAVLPLSLWKIEFSELCSRF